MTVSDSRGWWATDSYPPTQVDSPAGDPRAEPFVVVNTPSGPIRVPQSAAPPGEWRRYPGRETAPMPEFPPDLGAPGLQEDRGSFGQSTAAGWETTAAGPGSFPPAPQPPAASAGARRDDAARDVRERDDAARDDPEWGDAAWDAADWGDGTWNGRWGIGRRRAAESSGDRFRGYLASERESAAMYRELAGVSDGPEGEVLRQLADVEDEHAGHWENQLRTIGEPVPSAFRYRRSLRLRVVIWLARRFSLSAVLPMLEASENANAGLNDGESAAAPGMRLEERRHARLLAGMSAREVSRGGIGASERWHRGDRSGALRAAVFGVNDGLVSNASLVLGFVGSGATNRVILLAGIAGLLAGAFSMGAGEFVSVSSQREMFAAEVRLEEEELRHFPEGEERELALLYQAKGLPKEQAEETARKIMENPATALDTLAREELGLDPDELGSPWATAGSSAASFTAGAFVVVLPFLIGSGTAAAVTAVLLAALALAGVGGGLSLLAGQSPRRGATRQLVVGGLAVAAAFGIGGLLGVGMA